MEEKPKEIDWVKVLRPADTKYVISETFFPANRLA